MKRNRPELYQSAMRLFVRRPADHEYSEQIAGMTYQSQVWDTRRGSVGRRLCRSKGNVVMVRLSYAARAAVTPCIPFWAGKHGMTGRIAFESVTWRDRSSNRLSDATGLQCTLGLSSVESVMIRSESRCRGSGS